MQINFDLINIIIAVCATINILIGLLIVYQKRDNVGLSFFTLTFSIFLWSLAMIIFRGSSNYKLSITVLKFLYFFPIFVPISFLYFANVFPNNLSFLNKKKIFFISISSIVLSFLILTPNKLIRDVILLEGKENIIIFNQFIHLLYLIFIIFIFIIAYYVLFKKFILFKDARIKKHIIHIIIWTIMVAPVGVVTNVLLPHFGIFSLNWFAQISSIIMMSGICYAILKHHLFNIKIIAAEFFTFSLWTLIIIRILLSTSTRDTVINSGFLLFSIILGLFLIRSVMKEVSQREKIEKLVQELSLANEQLRDNNEKLKELDRMKTEFVSMASHQLRTPLTAIKGYSSILLEDFFGEIKDKVREAVDIVYQSSERLVVIIDDFLSITKIELGKMDFQISSFDLKDLVKVIVKESKVTADKKNLALELEILPGDYTFNGDHGKISQVISNILDNAMKYTEKGGIFAKLKDEGEKIKIIIKDTGIGMTKEDISQLFEKFVRVGQDGRPKYTGTGIGLFLVRQLVEAHQGRVWAESEGPDKGSTFVVEIPKEGKGE